MSRNTMFVVLAMLLSATLFTGCGPSTGNAAPAPAPIVDSDGGAVTAATTELTEAVTTGPACAYFAISSDIQHRLNHYRICVPEAGKEQKRLDALQEALNDCFEQCDDTCPDEGGSKTDSNLACVKQCKGE